MKRQPSVCGQCAVLAQPADRFCGSCGASLAEVHRVAVPNDGADPKGVAGPCSACGTATFADGYCTRCGQLPAEPDRAEVQLGGFVLITDRGREHARNEDAAAAGILLGGPERPDAIAVAVCDGVSTSHEAQTAAVAASRAGVDAMLGALAANRSARATMLAGLASATKAAAAAGTATDPSTAPSCTYTAAAVVPTSEGPVQIAVGNVGDSRVYWLPEPPASPQQLTVDDSVAQELMTAGAAADSEAVQRGAHTLTRWLGADAQRKPWADSSVQTITTAGSGWLVICSDGLWNYLPDAADIARFCTGADPTATARSLVDHALAAGGQDNITVAVIPIGGLSGLG